jgi:hypothetical protein
MFTLPFTHSCIHTHICTYLHRLHPLQHTPAYLHCLPHTQNNTPTPTHAHTRVPTNTCSLLHSHLATPALLHTCEDVHAHMHLPKGTLMHTHNLPHALTHPHMLTSLHTDLHVTLQTLHTYAQRNTHWQVLWIHGNKSQFLVSCPTHRKSVNTVPLTDPHSPPPPLQPLAMICQ